ncbi:hypothetical protein J6590_085355 [Homalodisca vitripennis]|nr:hypothetical protein J6590_085355 [Homalodisca vitripennis]
MKQVTHKCLRQVTLWQTWATMELPPPPPHHQGRRGCRSTDNIVSHFACVKVVNSTWKQNPKNTRSGFLKTLAKQLCENHQERRLTSPGMKVSVKNQNLQVLGKTISFVISQQSSCVPLERSKRKRCSLCRPIDGKTKLLCKTFSLAFCEEHGAVLCVSCETTSENKD